MNRWTVYYDTAELVLLPNQGELHKPLYQTKSFWPWGEEFINDRLIGDERLIQEIDRFKAKTFFSEYLLLVISGSILLLGLYASNLHPFVSIPVSLVAFSGIMMQFYYSRLYSKRIALIRQLTALLQQPIKNV